MRQPTPKWNDYVLLRDEALKIIPDNIDVFSIKKEFQMMITSKRKFERINTIANLIEVQSMSIQMFFFLPVYISNKQ